MGGRDPRVDEYIAKSREFARPILKHIREMVHAACPDVQETIKWQFPNFVYHGILCNMAAFKTYCTLGFWRPEVRKMIGPPKGKKSMGQFGQIRTLADLPADKVLEGYVRQAVKLHEAAPNAVPRPLPVRRRLIIPQYFMRAIRAYPRAFATFEKFSESHKREYVEWVTSAKKPETRDRRMQKTVQMINRAKTLNWKYEKKS